MIYCTVLIEKNLYFRDKNDIFAKEKTSKLNTDGSDWKFHSFGSPCWARTSDNAVNSRVLCQLS